MAGYEVTVGARVFLVEVEAGRVVTVDGHPWNGVEVRQHGEGVFDVVAESSVRRVVLRGGKGICGGVERAVLVRRAAAAGFRTAPPESVGGQPIVAPMPAYVARVVVEVGQVVTPGQVVVVLEAMKMENEIRSPRAGTVQEILVSPGMTVSKEQILIRLTA